MDKILLIDALNSIYRASVSFGFNPKAQHRLCKDCDKYIDQHQLGNPHCECGGTWFMLEDKCELEPDQDDIVVFNFFRNLRPIIEMFSPDKCFFVLEGHPQFRYDLYSEYKANRIVKEGSKKETKDRILRCKDEIIRLLQYLPITICQAVAYEADDTVATLCKNLSNEDVTVLSNDSDYIQLLQKGYRNCRVYNPIKKEFMEAPNGSYIQIKSLAGDKADNIPALLKPKKVEATIKDPEVFRKFMEVEENRANFNINRQLIEFRMVPEEEIILTEGVRNYSKLKEEFTTLKFESIINESSWEKYTKTFDCLKY